MKTRPAAVAGMFYPADRADLEALLEQLCLPLPPELKSVPRALIVPHAGLIYSGPVAAQAYQTVAGHHYKYILLLGPNHRVPLHGMAVPSAQQFETPLGTVPLAVDEQERLRQQGLVESADEPHRLEHCLEVQLPFLQFLDIQGPILPVVVGQAAKEQVAALIHDALADDQVLTLISSDLSHYHDYEACQQIDRLTSNKILSQQASLIPEEACGSNAINGLLAACEGKGYRLEQLARCNSGDTAGDKAQVVGYGAYAVY
ncbi:AmmeMemoRadiSam system protein B [Marinobacterium arenosum]|uniref:AmmeMemoRadiSam system protein B n=1 Tax=Marinobacterium arenosum TaxID=2862496 RepID=UPI001C9773BA|nr:AmmeMemoRadiSam system protein B [Marinobacterium arenosum]MBY4675249.1 AmmeMemoRadiSam system protein B [Marinobacterium arenosum]